MEVHLGLRFPEYVRVLGAELLREVIDVEIEHAANHGFAAESTVCQYIDLTFILGSGFATDPQLPWAAQILSVRAGENEFHSMERLADRAAVYLDQVAGPKNVYMRSAVTRLAAALRDLTSDSLLVAQRFQVIYPEKWSAIGEVGVREILADAELKCASYGYSNEVATQICAALMLALGSSFDLDPKFPWARSRLSTAGTAANVAAPLSLYRDASTFLERWVSASEAASRG
jgi:hypothetical protein